jgi:uncharacterized membrane protein YbhN (UPF0104 family)
MEQQSNKKLLFTVLKVAVSVLLLSLIVKKAGLDNVLRHLRSMDVRLFLLSTVIYIVVAWLVSLRWRILLDNRYPARKLFSLHMIGAFFNLVLPGSMGGDAVKVYYLYQETKQGGTSFGSVFLDRSLGLVARLSLGMVSGLFAFRELKTIGMHWAAPLLFAAFIAGSLLLFRLRIGRRFGAVADFYDYLHSSLKNRRMMLKAFLLSLIIQALLILMIAATARGIGQSLSFTELFVFVPIIITVMIVPLSISGFGVREGAFVVLFGLTGIPSSVSVSISFLWFLSMAAASLIGLVEYVRYRKNYPGW